MILQNILDTNYYVYNNSKHVKINQSEITNLIKHNKLNKPYHWLYSNPFNLLDLDIEDIVNFLIIMGAIDCSFWGNPKWAIKVEEKDLDGAFALLYCLLKLRKDKGHLNFELITLDEFKDYFNLLWRELDFYE